MLWDLLLFKLFTESLGQIACRRTSLAARISSLISSSYEFFEKK